MKRTINGLLFFTAVFAGTFAMAADNWFDPFFQYRIAAVIEVNEPGLNGVPITPAAIVAAINRLEEMQYSSIWFDYNRFKVVEVDSSGNVTDPNPVAGFSVVPESGELISPDLIGKKESVTIETEPNSYYLLRYTYEGANRYYSPASAYDPIAPSRIRKPRFEVSYEPKMLPKGTSRRERLFFTDGSPMKLSLGGSYVTGLKEISLKKVQIKLIADIKSPGKKQWLLYYQPVNGYNLVVPKLRQSELPVNSATVRRFGTAEKYIGSTRYKVADNDYATAWFAETTVKLTPNTPAPSQSGPVIKVAGAKNEKQSFQIVLNPKKSFRFKRITASDLKQGRKKISSSNISFYRAEYVPITRPSDITPVKFLGQIADPLVQVSSKQISPMEGNVIFWVTINTPAGTAPGKYKGSLSIKGVGKSSMTLPLELEVYDFELPEFSPFYSSMGGTSISKTLAGGKNVADYHHALTEKDIKKIARKYYTMMAENKFTPSNVLLYSKIGMKWSAPPKGYNIDKPGNFFKLYDWDFTEFNKDAQYYIDELKVNNFALVHTNPSVVQMFKHLPGKILEEYNRGPGWLTLWWQVFRELTYVGLKPGEKDSYIEISQAQYDKLITDFYRTIAENLERHGWLDRVYILVDETHYRGFGEYLNFLKVLKSDPLTARIRIAWCQQGAGAYNYKENPEDNKYAFNGLIDHYLPDWRECYNWWEKYFFTDYDIKPDRKKLWPYNTHTTRSAIDSPGINNRSTALHVFNEGGGGFLRWSTFDWDRYRCETDNPWEYPWTDICNGAMSYFYPPRKDGLADELDLTIVPSLRVMTYREGVDDFEYALMLEDLIKEAKEKGVDVLAAESVYNDIGRFFYNAVLWSQNDAYYLELRSRIAKEIVALNNKLK